MLIDCCGRDQWFARSVATIDAWANRLEPAPLVVLAWQPTTGALMRYADADTPCLLARMSAPVTVTSADALDQAIGDMVRAVARGQPCG